MHVRSITNLVHANSKFYAQNVSVLPVYNKIFPGPRPKLRPQGFDGDTCNFDPDLPIYRNQWIQHNAQALCEAYELDNFINMNGGRLNASPTEWMKLDPFLREAFKIAYNRYAREENQKQQKMQSDLDQKLEASKEYKSPFTGITKPTFIN
jgi:hypothetical protein